MASYSLRMSCSWTPQVELPKLLSVCTVRVAFCLIVSTCSLHFSLVSRVKPRHLHVSVGFISPHSVWMDASTLKGYSLYLYYLSLLSSPPSSLQICIVADKQGVLAESWGTTLIERATTRSTMRFSASETDVLEERELQNRRELHLSVFENTRNNPRVQKRKRPVTPCVPACLD
jgi:hypothetical protein